MYLRVLLFVGSLFIASSLATVSMNKDGDLFMHSLLGGDIVLSSGNGQVFIETEGQRIDILEQLRVAKRVAGQLCWLMPGFPRPQFGDVANFTGNQIRFGMASVTVGNEIYIIGGYSTDGTTTDEVQVFDTIAKSWRTVAPMNNQRAHPYAAASGDGKYIYVFGGFTVTNSGGTIQDQTLVLQVERYDIEGNTWTRFLDQQMPFSHRRGSMSTVNNVVYFFGGYESDGSLSSRVSAYDMTQQVWRASGLPDMMFPRARSTAAAVDDTIYVIGGQYYVSPAQVNASDAVHAYDTKTDTWSLRGNTIPRYDSTSVSLQGVIILIGGATNDPPLVYKDNMIYNPRVDGWKNSILGFMNSQRQLFTSSVVNDMVYTFGANYTVEASKPCF